ncbi:MAG: hypothetical protein JWM91_2346 [Rhodospirillales bacterium]|nr:hypothetical protein [Rhodospirillales bacterium]
MTTRTSRRGRPTREQAALRAETLFVVAANIFLSCGYDGTTMEKVALDAGITKPTLYAWYPNKELLFSAVLSHLHRQLPQELFLSELRELPLDAGLRLLARSLIQYSLRAECLILHRLMYREGQRFPELLRAIDRTTTMVISKALVNYLYALRETSVIRPVNPVRSARFFIDLVLSDLNRRVMMDLTMPLVEEIDAYVEDVVEHFVFGIKASKEPAPAS